MPKESAGSAAGAEPKDNVRENFLPVLSAVTGQIEKPMLQEIRENGAKTDHRNHSQDKKG